MYIDMNHTSTYIIPAVGGGAKMGTPFLATPITPLTRDMAKGWNASMGRSGIRKRHA